MAWDNQIFILLNRLTHEGILPLIFGLSRYVVIIGLLLIIVKNLRNIKTSSLILSAPILSWLIAHGLKILIGRPRPDTVITEAVLYEKYVGNSFPSGEAAFIFALATISSFIYPKKISIFFSFLAACIAGLSRVYIGAHYITDVIGGAILGILITITLVSWTKNQGIKKPLTKHQ